MSKTPINLVRFTDAFSRRGSGAETLQASIPAAGSATSIAVCPALTHNWLYSDFRAWPLSSDSPH